MFRAMQFLAYSKPNYEMDYGVSRLMKSILSQSFHLAHFGANYSVAKVRLHDAPSMIFCYNMIPE